MKALDGLHSPRLIALQQQLQNNNSAAIVSFWQELEAQGTPLVEPQNDGQSLVTLVWRDEEKHTPGELTCSLGGILNSRSMAPVLFQLYESNLWYRTFLLPGNVRATYHFFVNNQPVSDPLSKHTLTIPPNAVSVYGKQEMKLGIVELPDAEADIWSQQKPETPQGKLHTQLFSSTLVGHDYRLSVYTPHSYSSNGAPYPLLLLYDEWTHTTSIPAPTILDNMIAAGEIPPVVAVLFGHIQRDGRMREMAFYEPFFACVKEELLPYILQHYSVTHDSALTTVAGASMGGIAAMYSGLRYPELFGNVYSHTGSSHGGPPEERAYPRFEQEIQKHASTNQRFYLDVGMLEIDEMGCGSPDGGLNAVQSNRYMRNVLQAEGYVVTYVEYAGGHDMLWGGATLADGLKALLNIHRR